MKVQVTFTCDDDLRRAVFFYMNGGDGTQKASHADMVRWFTNHGYSVNEDALSEWASLTTPKDTA